MVELLVFVVLAALVAWLVSLMLGQQAGLVAFVVLVLLIALLVLGDRVG